MSETHFYPDVKPHISPSALAAWHNSKSAFIRSYFKGEKSPETEAMKAGKRIHALIEGGFLHPQKRYEHREVEIETQLGIAGTNVLGRPDSHGRIGGTGYFVDYKSGKDNNYSNETLATDLKMLCTAWLVWWATGQPKLVHGYIEYIPTRWNAETREIEPTGEESTVVAERVYIFGELYDFTNTILHTIQEVNQEYPKFLESSADFVSEEDCAEYARLEAEIKEREVKQDEIKARIGEQMTFGGIGNFETAFGTFYFTERKTYEYPADLPAQLEDGTVFNLSFADKVSAAVSAVKKNYELTHEPKTRTKSLGFRAARKAKK